MKAVERFDPAKGGKLSTYGSWWIKQSIKRALANQSKTIRLPVHLVDKISKMRRVAMKLQEEFGREPTDENSAKSWASRPSRVAQMRTAAIRPASLDAPIGETIPITFGGRAGRKCRHALRASRGKDRHENAAGNGDDLDPAGSDHPCAIASGSMAAAKRPSRKWARNLVSRANASGRSRTLL
jgi:RNA polymerase primary sigma factor